MKASRLLRLAPLAALALGSAMAQAETYALMIGINDYPDVVDGSGSPVKDSSGNVVNLDLSGPVNDVKSYKDLLVNKYGVNPDHIKLLLDKEANQDGFVSQLNQLIDKVKAGDTVVFVYSGHGTQIEDKDEEDGFEEAIVLHDKALVTGNLFNEVATGLSKAGVKSTFVFDSCFSGGMSRDVFSFDGQPGSSKRKFAIEAAAKTMKKFPEARANALKARAKSKTAAADGSYAFLFAGKEDQPTTDLDFKDEATPDHGLFTLLFVGLMEEMPTAPLDEAIEAISDVLKEKGFDQRPTFEFSSKERGKQPFILK